MLSFFGTQQAHDACETYCPEFLYDYLKEQGLWRHLFQDGFCEQISNGLVRAGCEHPVLTSAAALTALLGTGAAIHSVMKSSDKSKADEVITPVVFSAPTPTHVDTQANASLTSSSSIVAPVAEDEEECFPVKDDVDTDLRHSTDHTEVEVFVEPEPLVLPEKMDVASLLEAVFNYLKERRHLEMRTLADNLGIKNERNIEGFRKLSGFPDQPELFASTVINGLVQHKRALSYLELPMDGRFPSTPEQLARYRKMCETVGLDYTSADNRARASKLKV